jgi:6-phosphofructokinase 1
MVIVVAEGAGQELIAESMGSLDKINDASGNKLLLDVGLWLCQNLTVRGKFNHNSWESFHN